MSPYVLMCLDLYAIAFLRVIAMFMMLGVL